MSSKKSYRKKVKEADALSTERFTVIKNWKNRIPVAVVFPNSYYIGMSNLAVHMLYKELNRMDDVVCERFFLDSMNSLESGRPLTSFELAFFTLSFELDYVNIPSILRRSSIELHACDRREKTPVIIGGGVCVMSNPEPVHSFFDLFALGNIEATVQPLMDTFRENRHKRRDAILEGLSRHEWVYNPGQLEVAYTEEGTVDEFIPADFRVRINYQTNDGLATSAIISEQTEFSNMFLVEGSRGCPSRCPFCLLGSLYDFVCDDIDPSLTQIDDIGIIGGGVSFYPGIEKIVKILKDSGKNVHLPSMRLDRISIELIDLMKNDISTLTFGIEAAAEKLRNSIGKPFSNDEILKKIGTIFDIKLFNLKLYFMIGLFGEDRTDIDAIVELTKEIRHIMMQKGARRGFVPSITVHVSPFVPKAFTPFQWLPMDEVDSLKNKINRLKSAFGKVDNTYFTHESVKFSFLQGVFARGDRRVSGTILNLSGDNNFSRVMNESPINLNFYTLRERHMSETFPWDFIKGNASKETLQRRLKTALQHLSRTWG
ncbi:MAG TPA: hypothetical protein VHO84_07975 [Syntrophorhabdaceae bacterium]|nr:hypothetical protein [Syntrophorhabdaceae bacterium]